MDNEGSRGRKLDRVALLLALALFLFASPFTDWWASVALPWFTPFVLWALVIALIFVDQWQRPDRED